MKASVSAMNVGDYMKKMVSYGLGVTVNVKDGFMLYVLGWMRQVYPITSTVIIVPAKSHAFGYVIQHLEAGLTDDV